MISYQRAFAKKSTLFLVFCSFFYIQCNSNTYQSWTICVSTGNMLRLAADSYYEYSFSRHPLFVSSAHFLTIPPPFVPKLALSSPNSHHPLTIRTKIRTIIPEFLSCAGNSCHHPSFFRIITSPFAPSSTFLRIMFLDNEISVL